MAPGYGWGVGQIREGTMAGKEITRPAWERGTGRPGAEEGNKAVWWWFPYGL